MEGFKTQLKSLVISQPLAQRLVALGVRIAGTFHWYKDFDFEGDLEAKEPKKTWQLGDIDVNDYGEGEVLPALTMEELRIMIGWHYNGSDLVEHRPNPMPGEELQFVNYYSASMKRYESGAEATGEWLEHLIKKEHLSIDEVNERYTERFKPE